MNDLPVRLRDESCGFGIGHALLMQEAASEVERLRAGIQEAIDLIAHLKDGRARFKLECLLQGDCDRDRDREADETRSGSVGEADRARAEGIAPISPPPHPQQ